MKSIHVKLIPIIPLLLFCQTVQAQFFTNGSARTVNDSCFLLTNDVLWEVGSIWYPDKIDLRNDFDLVMTMNFGSNDLMGADGIVFGLQPISTTIGEARGRRHRVRERFPRPGRRIRYLPKRVPGRSLVRPRGHH